MAKNEPKAFDCIRIVPREKKPREIGLTYVRDQGMGLKAADAFLQGAGEYVDILKLAGFGVRMQSKQQLIDKVKLCADYQVEVGLGGALLEISLLQGEDVVDRFLAECQEVGISHIEVCRQAAIMPLDDILELIEYVKTFGLKPIAEVGVAYGISEEDEVDADEARLISTLQQCKDAGAWMLLLESEGITESRKPQDMRWDIVSKVAAAFDVKEIMFEADDVNVYTYYIQNYGPEVNLFVDFRRAMSLEGARRGGWAKNPLINRVATFSKVRDRG